MDCYYPLASIGDPLERKYADASRDKKTSENYYQVSGLLYLSALLTLPLAIVID